MAQKLQIQLKQVGSSLQNPPASKDAVVTLLTEAAASLSEMDQSPSKALLESMQTLMNAIVKPEYLKHQDEQVKLLVAACTCEITRITAPEAPYDDDVLKDIFHLFVSTFKGLKDTKDPSFGRIVNILDTVAKYRSFVVMLDLECDDLVNEMFKTFFNVASDEHTEIVTVAMETIMAVLLEESEDIGEDLLLTVLSVLGRDKKDVSEAARRLGMEVIRQCAGKLEPGIKQFILSSISGASKHHIDYHEVIYDVYRCAPQVLKKVVPSLTKELLTDKVDLRVKAVRLVGDLFAHKGSAIPKTFQPIFTEFLKRSSDDTMEVRMSVLEKVKLCLLSDPFREEAPKLLSALRDRLSDDDESIRKQVVAVVSDVASHDLSSISSDTIKLVAAHLEDKSLLVKKYTLERLSDIYRISCLKQHGGSNLNDDYDWIPGRILKCLYEKDLEPDTVEQILYTSLFPAEFSVKDKVKKWVKLFSNFNEVEVKALEKLLEQKQRLQLDLHKYLSLRQTYLQDNDASELQKKAAPCIRSISHCFVNPTKAEADFQLLDQSKDVDNIWKILTTLLDATTSSHKSRTLRDELLKIVDEKHPLYELLSTLSIKCSYTIFDKEFVKDLVLETDLQKSDGNKTLTKACMDILAIVGCFSPLLLSGMENDLAHLLEDDDEVIKEGALHVLAKAGETIREQSGESSSSLDLILERICLEGTRKQAKYAVHALAAITKDKGLKSLSVLYKRLVDILEKRTNLPSVLQSLGCIAQIAMPVFETQESKVIGFIRKSILSCGQKTGDKAKESWDARSELCSLKIFGIKTLVKSYLPVKDAHLRVGIDELLKDLQNLLSFGEISKDVESSSVDKAHLKLASAKAIIRLSKHWDKKIPIDLFHLTMRTSEVGFPEVKKLFLNKVHQYIKDKSLDSKYACAFLLDFGPQNTILEEEHQNLKEIIEMCDPEYILPYLVHALAHHPSCPKIDECKDIKAYELIYRKLYVFFSKLAAGDEDGLRREDINSINSVVRSIKRIEDAVDTNMTKNSHAICDLCLSITKRLARNKEDVNESVVRVSLPQVLYAPDKNKENENKEDGKKEEITEDDKKQEIKEDEKIEKTEEDENKQEIDTDVAEGQTWLADENALAYFESLTLEANGDVPSISNEDDILKDSENDVPLGKMLKLLKAKGSKAKNKKVVNNGSAPAVVEAENNIDILGMLKEINSDNADVSNKFDSSNGHGKISSETKLKRKSVPNNLSNVSVPKRRRSSPAKGQKRSTYVTTTFNINKMEDDSHDDDDKVTLKASTNKASVHKKDSTNTDERDTKPKKPVEADNNQKSGPIRKRKRRRISGLAKCTVDETPSHKTDLVGRRIQVWWPMDKAFYKGVVKSYDPEKKKHVVSYDDGDVEVLQLDKERWEFVENEHKPKQPKRLSTSSPSKGGSSKKKLKSSSSSKKAKESAEISPSSTVRGKRTPRKNLKQGQKGVSQRAEYLEIVKSKDLDTLMHEAEPETEPEVDTKPTKVSKDDSLDTEGKTSSNEHDESSEGEEDSDKVKKSSPVKKQIKDAESSSSDTASSQGIEAESAKKETEKADIVETDKSHKEEDENNNSDSGGESADAQTPEDKKGSTSDEPDDAEFPENEPLVVWKSRVGKTVKGK
ncbi:putative sister chromatid cohesion protein Pds5 [Helianthus debilis subsp. tardiflorus]